MPVMGVALAAAALVAGCSGGDPSPGVTVTVTPTITATATPSTPSSTTTTTTKVIPPQSYADALQHLGTGTADPAEPSAFVSPTGNIYCSIVAGATRGCELKAGRIAPPTTDFCTNAGGGAADIGRVQFGPAGPLAVCNEDAIAKEGVPVLKYGSRTTSGSVACVSESIGMTCLDASTQKGFFLARDTFFIF